MNIEQLWMVSKAWYFEGGRKNREWEEVMAYLVGVEGAIKVAYESLGKYSKAVFEATTSVQELEDRFVSLLENGE